MFSPPQTSARVDTLSLVVFLSSCVELRSHFVHRYSKSLTVYVIGLSHSVRLTFHKSINPYACVYTNNLRALCLFRFRVTAQPDCVLRSNVYIFFAGHVNFRVDPNTIFVWLREENAASNVRCDCCCSFRMQKIVMSSHVAPTFAHAQTHTTMQYYTIHEVHKIHTRCTASPMHTCTQNHTLTGARVIARVRVQLEVSKCSLHRCTPRLHDHCVGELLPLNVNNIVQFIQN